MKKMLLLTALLIPFLSHADPDHRGGHRYEGEHRERHIGFGWGEFVGGLIIGSIIAHQIDGHYYDDDDNEVRRIVNCLDYPLTNQTGEYMFDRWGHLVIERRCVEEWVRVR